MVTFRQKLSIFFFPSVNTYVHNVGYYVKIWAVSLTMPLYASLTNVSVSLSVKDFQELVRLL